MEMDLSRLARSFTGKRVLVLGEAILDVYLGGTIERLCREAPVPVIALTNKTMAPGGAANTAANLAALGGTVHFLSVVGEDAEGLRLRQLLSERGIAVDGLLTERDRETLAKHRLIGASQMLARFDQGDRRPIRQSTEEQIGQRLEALFAQMDAVVLSDYGYGVIGSKLIRLLADLQHRTPATIVADSSRLERFASIGVTAVKPSYSEALRLLGRSGVPAKTARAEAMAAAGPRILEKAGARMAAITLDVEGVVVVEQGGRVHRTYARPAHSTRSTGGGDTFVAAMSLALAAGADTAEAAELASAAAAVVVGKEGTATCSAAELTDFISGKEKRIGQLDELTERITFHRGQGRRIVFTNGCFDILHRGHVGLLNRAKALGDVLIVGINSDASVRRLKGQGRPINGLEDRLNVLAALSYVDHIIPFDGDTPAELIRAVRPDIFVKGGDYSRETLPEAPLVERLGGAICVLPFTEQRSTSHIIQRIRQGAP